MASQDHSPIRERYRLKKPGFTPGLSSKSGDKSRCDYFIKSTARARLISRVILR